MRYNPNDPRDYFAVINLLDMAKRDGKQIDVKIPGRGRTLQQNGYYHLILRYYASQIGLTETEAEKEFKYDCEANREKFLIERTDKKGNIHYSLRSSADLSKEEMSSAIANFIAYAEFYAGVIIPYDCDYGHIQEAKNEIERNSKYI